MVQSKQKTFSKAFVLTMLTAAYLVIAGGQSDLPSNQQWQKRSLLSQHKPIFIPGINCTSPAYLEFPADLFTEHQRESGAIIVHFLVVIYIFIALAIVCDDYFVASLGHICEMLNFSEDVAGATFMAIGSSCPELFTSIIGVFVAKGDVGTGTILGSAVFNVLCIVGVCALFAGRPMQLNWWPIARDCTYYAASVFLLIFVMHDDAVTWYESLLMLLMYAGYITVMKYNTRIQQAVQARFPTLDWAAKSTLVTDYADNESDASNCLKMTPGDTGDKVNGGNYYQAYDSNIAPNNQVSQANVKQILHATQIIRSPYRKLRMYEAALILLAIGKRFRPRTRIWAAAQILLVERRRLVREGKITSSRTQKTPTFKQQARRSFSRQLTLEDPDNPEFEHWKIPPHPKEVGCLEFAKWCTTIPIKYAYYFTIPDCRKTRWQNWYIVTFLVSITWIGLLSFVMVWMVTLAGYTLGISDSIMGITFLAAGTSLPDLMASLIVARKGQGDMAVSNTIGSNVFDILLGLALPWFLQTALMHPGSKVIINSSGLVYSVVLLFASIAALVGGIKFYKWELNKNLGYFCLCAYLIFLVVTCMIEANVFGFVNPPICLQD